MRSFIFSGLIKPGMTFAWEDPNDSEANCLIVVTKVYAGVDEPRVAIMQIAGDETYTNEWVELESSFRRCVHRVEVIAKP